MNVKEARIFTAAQGIVDARKEADALRAAGAVAKSAGSPFARAARSVHFNPQAHAGGGGLSTRGRVTVDTVGDSKKLANLFVLRPPVNADDVWRNLNLDAQTLSKKSPKEVYELLCDISPEVSRALWDHLRFCNPGWEMAVSLTVDGRPYKRGERIVQKLFDRLEEYYGTVDQVLDSLFLGAFLRGAFFAELVLGRGGREAVDLLAVDPWTARFKRVDDPVRGKRWQLGQMVDGDFVAMEYPTVRYVPIDPFPGSPYGRALISPGAFSAIFLLMMFHDLRRVIAQQGYPRIDIAVELEQLASIMPDELEGDFVKQQVWIQEVVTAVKDVYSRLEPDDAYVHTSLISVNHPKGALNASSLSAVDGIVKALERMATRALKTMPLLMGINDTTTETHANRQWEIFAAGTRSLQHGCETMVSNLLAHGMRAEGVRGYVKFRFTELRASEELRDTQTEMMRIRNAQQKYVSGWIDQDTAAQEGAGVENADVPEPRGETKGEDWTTGLGDDTLV